MIFIFLSFRSLIHSSALFNLQFTGFRSVFVLVNVFSDFCGLLLSVWALSVSLSVISSQFFCSFNWE